MHKTSIHPDVLTPAILMKEKEEAIKRQKECYHTFGMYNSIDDYLVEVYSVREKTIAEDRHDYHEFNYCPKCGVELETVEMPIGDEDE